MRPELNTRLRLLMGATALLYLGPVLAGLGGFGWGLVPVFAAIFLLWLFILRPHQWPRRTADWARSEALIALAAQGTVQVLLVTVLFAVGRGLGGVLGALPPFPAMLPIAVSFLSIPLSRLIWDPWKAAEMDRFLDSALRQISHPGQSFTADPAQTEALLSALPPNLPEPELERHLEAMITQSDPETLLKALLATASDVDRRRTLVVLATLPRAADLMGGDYPTRALRAAQTPALQRLFARRCAALLEQDADVWPGCPSPEYLAELAQSADPETAAALLSLADLTRRMAPADGL